MKGNVTWILVADHQHGRILENDGPGKGVREVPGVGGETHLHRSGEIMADRPGRSFESADVTRHAMERPSDPHRIEGQRFLAGLIERLETAEQEKRFDRLVLVAPPRALGELRKLLPETLAAKVIGEVDRDLVKLPANEIAPHLESFMAP